jgi:hypothetical protein
MLKYEIFWVLLFIENCLQLSISPNNEDAMHGIERIEPLRQSVEGSKILQARGDHHGAYSLLTDAIEVKNCQTPVNICFTVIILLILVHTMGLFSARNES